MFYRENQRFLLRNTQRVLFLSLVLSLLFTFGILRTLPENNHIPRQNKNYYGNLDRTVTRVFDLAVKTSQKKFSEVRNHFNYLSHNPGLFMFIAELGVRIGINSPQPLQIFSLFLFGMGIIFQYLWLLHLFRDDFIPILASFYLIVTPYFLYYSGTLHYHSYVFLGFNSTLYFYLKYLRSDKKLFYIAALLSYLIVCLNYYMFYMSTFLMVTGLGHLEGKKIIRKDLFGFLAMATGAILLVFLQCSIQKGGIDKAVIDMVGIFVARTVDARIENTTWHPNQYFMGRNDWLHYPQMISAKVKWYFFCSIETYLIAGIASLTLNATERVRKIKFFIILVISGLSWNLVMFQHSKIHGVSTLFGYFTWMILTAFILKEVYIFFKEKTFIPHHQIVYFVIISPLIFYYFSTIFFNRYIKGLYLYIGNLS